MAFERMQRCGALLLALIVPAAVMASDWAGTITTSSGAVTLNGQPIRGSHTMLPGDLVKTAKGQMMVRLETGSVAIGEHSTAKFENSTVTLTNGFAQISGSRQLTARYRDLTIHSVGTEQASFVVGELDGKPTVATLKGAVLISDGNGSVVLPAGRAIETGGEPDLIATADEQQQQQGAEPAVKGRHSTNQEEERGGKKNRKVLSGWWETVIILGAIGALIGGLAAGGVFDRHPASNQSAGPIIVP